ncbi:MAG: UDP-glucose 4-epimerase GalE [Peptococcaceae bacterium]|jgi:UDP-glucose 4-epimerase|nr:UDP-glucose 4-epimerase GalE [Peptococcaceae bacterium]MDH7523940.1 UDP-glucose 4-epimerase GalE [Peptococcaceae bacterium]
MKPVLVTGGAGYIGSHTVAELIKAGVPVAVLDNLSTGHREAVASRHFYEGDIADLELVRFIIETHEIGSVIHFAAKSLVSESYAQPELYFRENTAQSFAFLEEAVKAGVKQVVLSSTAAVYGIPEAVPISEGSPLEPINPYGASKRMIEEYLQWMGRAHGIGWIALRYFNAAGAALDGQLGEDHRPEMHLVPLMLQTALGLRQRLYVYGTDYDTPDGTCIRDYIHVLDLAKAHILALGALENGLPGRALNVGTGRGFSVMEIIQKAEALIGDKLPVEYVERRAGDPHSLVADNSAMKSVFGWEPEHSDLDTILSSALRWHSAHPYGYGEQGPGRKRH